MTDEEYIAAMRSEMMDNIRLIRRCICRGNCVECVGMRETNDAMEQSIMRLQGVYE